MGQEKIPQGHLFLYVKWGQIFHISSIYSVLSLICFICPAIMDLPNELLLQILSHLNRSDLKNARLVSRTWSLYSSEYLFDTIYASTQKEDLTVFNAVAQHPVLSKCVRTLDYGTVTFDKTLSLSDYVERLWDQLIFNVPYNPDGHYASFDHPDSDVNTLVQLLRERSPSTDYEADAQRLCLGMHFIQDGYADWKRRAEQEIQLKANNYSSKGIVQGLSNLTRLQSARLNSAWFHSDTKLSSSASLPRVLYGSPLARQWNIFQPFPLEWHGQPDTSAHGCRQGMSELYGVAGALAAAGKTASEFQVQPHNSAHCVLAS